MQWGFQRKLCHIHRVAFLTGTALAAGAVSPAAFAQADTAVAPEEEIIVSALRRDTNLQDTPIAISVATGVTLERSGTTSFTELTRTAPSLRIVDSGPGNRRVLIRGIQSSGEPTVGVYYDEVPVSGSVSTTSDSAGTTPDFRLFDVERAEVLRGPQGTLFGSGSMGGTMRIIFQKPDATGIDAAVSASMSSVKGGNPGMSVDSMVNLPIVTDKLAIRLVGNFNQFAGYVDNSHYGYRNINDGHSYGGRALLRWEPIEDLTIDLAAFYEKVATDSPRWIQEVGELYVTNGRSESGNYDTNRIYSGTLKYDFGPVSMTAMTAWFDRDRTAVGDVSDTFNGRDTAAGCQRYLLLNARACTPTELSSYLTATREIQTSSLWQPQTVKNWVSELRFNSTTDGPFQWTVGAFHEKRDTVVRSTLLLADPQTGWLLDPNDPYNIRYDRTINDYLRQTAVFAEISYKLFDQLTLTAGTRYYNFKKTVGGRIDVGQIHYSSRVTPYTEVTSKEDGFIYKFNVSWEAKDGLMLYAQAAQGFRPGGVNQVIGLPAELAGYSSDSLWNYELGAKTTLAPGVYFNLAGYRIDWNDMQVSARTAGTGSVFGLISNVGSARIWGAEAELSVRITPELSFNGNLGFTDARLAEDQVSTIVVASGRKGDRLVAVPRWTAGASLEYLKSVGDTIDLLSRIDFAHVGNSYSTLSETDIYRRESPAYQMVNFRIGLQGADNEWNAALFVNNVFDVLAINSIGSSSNTGGLTTVYSTPPRTIGLSLGRRF
ncbi:TonB-dependent receptor [Sandaracinobacter sp.]|uniref:TonB-dependent receptor n=1 Tax=Sandaracinobacter sp. TaxID=2487581 RepID=UPI0035B04542